MSYTKTTSALLSALVMVGCGGGSSGSSSGDGYHQPTAEDLTWEGPSWTLSAKADSPDIIESPFESKPVSGLQFATADGIPVTPARVMIVPAVDFYRVEFDLETTKDQFIEGYELNSWLNENKLEPGKSYFAVVNHYDFTAVQKITVGEYNDYETGHVILPVLCDNDSFDGCHNISDDYLVGSYQFFGHNGGMRLILDTFQSLHLRDDSIHAIERDYMVDTGFSGKNNGFTMVVSRDEVHSSDWGRDIIGNGHVAGYYLNYQCNGQDARLNGNVVTVNITGESFIGFSQYFPDVVAGSSPECLDFGDFFDNL